jgi:hypothetical protein
LSKRSIKNSVEQRITANQQRVEEAREREEREREALRELNRKSTQTTKEI